MFFIYNNSRDSKVLSFLPLLNASDCVFDALDGFSSYKERFVISRSDDSLANLDTIFFTHFFSYDSFWWRADLATWAIEQKEGTALLSDALLGQVLKNRRGFLLQFGQRRVCTRAAVWFLSDIWTVWSFNAVNNAEMSVGNRYTYRHLAQSDLFPAGTLLGQPNFYFFVYILSNPYFWSVLQQTLNSQYRYR